MACYNIGIQTEDDLPNKHLEHLEDSIFDGRRAAWRAVWTALTCKSECLPSGTVLLLLCSAPIQRTVSSSLEQSPFSTKSKLRLIMIMMDIDEHYKGNVANILRLCLYHLPRLSGIIQADSSVSAEVLFIALTLWSIVSPVRSVAILSLLHTLLIPRFLRMLWGVAVLISVCIGHSLCRI